MKNSIKMILLFVIVLLLFTACAHVVPIQACVQGADVYGFWGGLWHGIIICLSFIGSLFDHSIAIYAVNNNGAWYNLGYVLGVGGVFGGGIKIVFNF